MTRATDRAAARAPHAGAASIPDRERAFAFLEHARQISRDEWDRAIDGHYMRGYHGDEVPALNALYRAIGEAHQGQSATKLRTECDSVAWAAARVGLVSDRAIALSLWYAAAALLARSHLAPEDFATLYAPFASLIPPDTLAP